METASKTETLQLEGLHCGDCAATIEKTVAKMAGVNEVKANFGSGKLKVNYNPVKISLQELINCVEKIGYRVITSAHKNIAKRIFWKQSEFVFMVISGILLGAGLLARFFFADPIILNLDFYYPFTLSVLLFLAATFIGAYHFAKEGWFTIRNLNYSIGLLMLIAIIGAVGIGEHFEAASLAFLYALAELLEGYAVDKARNSLRELMTLTPEKAIIKKGAGEIAVKVNEVQIGDILVVRPGEKIALDGEVVAGISSVDQSPITGESLPIKKEAGQQAYAGSINNEGYLEIKVTKNHENTMLARIIHLVEDAESQKAPTERFVEKFAKIYTPAVVILAIAVAAIPPLLLGEAFTPWFLKALTLLVISCPCALVISTPVSVVSALTSASRNGVLIKGGAYLEEMSHIKVIAFDKTGTLTKGKLRVTDVIPLNGLTKEKVLHIAASLEQKSEHPIAKAIIAASNGGAVENPTDFTAIPGKGVVARLNGNKYVIGREELFADKKSGLPAKELQALQNQGKTTMLVGNDTEIVGIIALSDEVRKEAVKAIARLKAAGQEVVMLTGDNAKTAATIAGELGIEKFYADLLPEDKVNIVKQLTQQYGKVAMVGDGINDAPALAAAAIGIAMGVAGTDAALETANIALMSDDINKLIYLLKLSQKATAVIKENTFASIIIKFSLAIGVFPGMVSLVVAVLAGDMGASLAVTTNAMRLARFNPKG